MQAQTLKRSSLLITVTLIIGVLSLLITEASIPSHSSELKSRRTIIVNASGGGDFITIQAAINVANNGDTVFVESGMYQENVVVNKEIRLVGAGWSNTTINGSGVGKVVHITADHVTIRGFTTTNGNHGIYIKQHGNLTIMDNNCSGNLQIGILLDQTTNSFISNNICNTNGGFKPVGYWVNYGGEGIYMINSNNNTVIGNECNQNLGDVDPFGHLNEGGGCGIYLISCNDNQFMNNSCNQNRGYGFYLEDGRRNIFGNNTISSQIEGGGVQIYMSKCEIVINNTIINNAWGGIFLYCCEEVVVSNNYVFHNGGEWFSVISLSNSSNNRISHNTFSENGGRITIWNETDISENNFIYANNFLNNNNGGIQAYDEGMNNKWNDTFIKGNYWSDYTFRYPNAHNNSIVWNTPYGINGSANSKDFFPLCNPVNNTVIYPIVLAGKDITIDQHQIATFNGSRSYDYFCITNYTWNFRYNNTNSSLFGPTPTFIFHTAGTYVVTLTVTNIKGCKDSDHMKVYVLDVDSPIPDAGLDAVIRQGETFILNGSGSWDNTGIVNFSWNFTYNNTDALLYGTSPHFTFHISGRYDITLNTTDARGNWAADAMLLTVRDSTWPVAKAGRDITVDQYETAHFDASASYDNIEIVNYTWYFVYLEREIYIYGISPRFTFDEVGIYIVTLYINDAEGNWAIDSLNVTVQDITLPIADAGQNITAFKGDIVFFNSSSSYDNVAIVNYTWTFIYDNKSVILFGPRPKFKFEIGGNYSITLRVKDAVNLWDEDIIWITIREIEKLVDNGSSPVDKNPPLADAGSDVTIENNPVVQFNGTGSWDNMGIVNYSWQFLYNDSLIILFGPDPTFKFDMPGNYTITLRVLDAEGNFDDDTIIITVKPQENDIPDDETLPDDVQENEKGAGISLWIWLVLMICIATIIIVLIYFTWNRTEDKVEQSLEDELGRVKKSDESDGE